VTVKAGHVQPLWAGHPWVFKQAIERVDEAIASGDEVLVLDPHGKVLGRGLYAADSAIAVRILTSQGGRSIDAELFRERIDHALRLRQAIGLPDAEPGRQTSGFRLLHGEGDGVPGLIVDRFDETLVVQIGTPGLRRLAPALVAVLAETLAPRAIVDRTPRALTEGEPGPSGQGPIMLHGEAPEALSFHERGIAFELPLALQQKTGFYFDQRPLRRRIEELSRGSRVLDAFCYVGAVGLSAARGGATEVWGVDTSAPAIEVAARTAELNQLPARFEQLDAHRAFRKAADEGGYDIVICDPPKIPSSRRSRGKPGAGYRKLAAAASAATKPGGLLAFCSCTAAVNMDALARALALGARDAGRRALIVERLFQGADHPVLAAFPEGLYLTVLLARIEMP
jgi:23S rRNA (cytosine1962-C5)-methyltransferase